MIKYGVGIKRKKRNPVAASKRTVKPKFPSKAERLASGLLNKRKIKRPSTR